MRRERKINLNEHPIGKAFQSKPDNIVNNSAKLILRIQTKCPVLFTQSRSVNSQNIKLNSN